MTRIDRLPERALASELKRLEDEARNSKLAQLTSTNSGLQLYQVDSGATWDYSDTLSGTGKSALHTFKYTPARNQANSFTRFFTKIYISSIDSSHVLNTATQAVSGSGYQAVLDLYKWDKSTQIANGTFTFLVDITFTGTFQYWIKGYFLATDTGALSVTRSIT